MKVVEMFEGIQGEGKYAGYPCVFIRLSGCTRKCSFCDSKFHIKGKDVVYEDIINFVKNLKSKIIVWTGGEPLLQREGIYDIIKLLDEEYTHHIETNGDLLQESDFTKFLYIACSPKEEKAAKKVDKLFDKYLLFNEHGDIKVVTDGIHIALTKYATMLMPLSIDFGGPKDKSTEKRVWNLCIKKQKKFCLRQHICVWGKRQGV